MDNTADTYKIGVGRLGRWDDVRGSAVGMDEVNTLVSALKTRMPIDLQARFDGASIDQAGEGLMGR